jgi:hypothetical protein
MEYIALYAAAVFGLATSPVPGATSYVWQIAWTDGPTQTFTTTEAILRDVPSRDGHCFTSVICATDAAGAEFCSGPSDLYCVNPLVGDTDLDGVVGGPDFVLFGQHFGERAPP